MPTLRLLAVLSLLGTAAPLLAQTCAAPKLVNGLNLELACVQYSGQNYAMTLENLSASALSWRFGGTVAPATCTPEPQGCATVGSDLGITIRQMEVGGTRYRLELAMAPQLGSLTWQYKSHSVEPTTLTVLTPTVLAAIKSYMEQLVSAKTIPGAVLGVAEGSNLTLIEAYGMADADASTVMRTDTLLHIGSTNKAITSFMLATLVDDGALTWDTKVRDVYAGFNPPNASSAANITVRHMLDMTSGLPREAGFETSDPPRRMLDGLGSVALVGAPGEKYAYSNVSTSAAGFLAPLAKIKMTRALTDADLDAVYTGYDTLLQDKVLKPIGMTASYLSVTDARATGKMAKSHALVNGVWTVSASVDTAVDNAAPSGGLKSTATDMLRYIVTDMQGGVNPEGTRVASAANITERQKLSVGQAAANKYGLCLEISEAENGLAYVGHNGSFDNFNSVMGWFPAKKVAFVLLTNGESTAITDLTGTGFINRLAEIVR